MIRSCFRGGLFANSAAVGHARFDLLLAMCSLRPHPSFARFSSSRNTAKKFENSAPYAEVEDWHHF